MSLYIENLSSKYSDYLINIVCANPASNIFPVTGIILDEDMTLDMDATFSQSDVTNATDAAQGALTSAAKNIAGGAVANMIKKKFSTLIQSAEDWQGGAPFSFSVTFNVFKTGIDGAGTCSSYQKLLENLARYTQPKPGSVSSPQQSHYDGLTAESITKAAGNASAKEAGLFTVTIGKWFYCRLLQPTKASMKLSTYVDLEGSPIYATVTVAFKTYRILSSEEWGKIIKA